jgi:hypothetical protein
MWYSRTMGHYLRRNQTIESVVGKAHKSPKLRGAKADTYDLPLLGAQLSRASIHLQSNLCDQLPELRDVAPEKFAELLRTAGDRLGTLALQLLLHVG